MDLRQLALEAEYADHSHYVLREQIISRCGYLAAIPQEPLLYGLYYNADAFRDAEVTDLPESWEDFLALSGRLTSAGYMPLTIDSEHAHLILELFLERHLGAQQFQTMLAQALWTSTTEYIEMFRKPIDYAAAGYLAKGDPAAFPGGQNKIALSNVAMVAGSSELCAQVERSTIMNVNWGVMAFPGDGPGTGCGAESRVLAVHKDSANARAAFDFIMLLTRGEFDQLYADVTGGIPADPGNECGIEGAVKLLETADVRGFGLLTNEDQELFSRLWNGWYKTPGYFASAMNQLAPKYPAPASDGVG
jgi:raffinose/stachyose/melibiose transport system substrate-binding protein